MPRALLDRRYWERLATRQGRHSWRANVAPPFIDYYPEVEGTLPEKMIFNELAKRRINFYFNPYFGDFPFTPSIEHYRPDFVLPDYDIILNVNGIYWHSQPGKFESDYVQASLYEAAGWHLFLLTDQEILFNVIEAVDSIPQLRNPIFTGTNRVAYHAGASTAAPIIARIKARPPVIHVSYKGTKYDRKHQYKAGRAIAKTRALGPLFLPGDISAAYQDTLNQFSSQWFEYLKNLNAFFTTGVTGSFWLPDDSEQGGHWVGENHGADLYPQEYQFWLQWRNWWQRFRLTYIKGTTGTPGRPRFKPKPPPGY